jgi:threonine synthase
MDAGEALSRSRSFGDLAGRVARHLLGDEVPAAVVEATVEEALDFPLPLVDPSGSAPASRDGRAGSPGAGATGAGVRILELFHGPSLAFKDFGARFMAALMERVDPDPDPVRPRTVLVATSGDTGGAVAGAFHGREGFRVVVLFPRDGVSGVQRRLFTTLGGNVTAVAVRGDFDDCQRMVKEAFRVHGAEGRYGEAGVGGPLRLTSANSINAGRLLPQSFYYAEAVRLLEEVRRGDTRRGAVFSVPSGNLGNLTAGMLARRLGFPVRGLVAATNANDAFRRWLEAGDESPRPAVRTVSNAMDVARPSNLERIRWLVSGDRGALKEEMTSYSFDDEATLACMARVEEATGYLLDPHGAVAFLGAEAWRRDGRGDDPTEVVALATAHPAKFPDVVGRAVGRDPMVPARLRRAMAGEERSVEVEPTVEALVEVLEDVRGGGG